MPRFDAVLFDCDGVLVDSERITNGVLRDMLEELGWKLSREECMRIFVGKAVKDEAGLIEARTGQPLTEEWMTRFRERRNEGLAREVQPIAGAVQAVEAIAARLQGRIAVASGADRFKVELQLQRCGLWPFFEGRVYSGHETPRSKPAPDVYLAAAAGIGADPARCLVVEDTVTGVTAGVAAGATVFGYCPPEAGHDAPEALQRAGAQRIFTALQHLPAMLDD
ncbi:MULTISPECIES: HAD family phosphatase [Ramlibacter]|uniref:HAD family phosphatase n=1 Tax=Ramlibacter aquaticus TaxID=2780094 RepID=A0ABR9SKN0_9BURK|nr:MULTISPECIES: HAD family phosphatase [Ramlibacter]MBE7942454.1 HAD family phosphatase [Ramlibacter aquaticus]